MAAPVVSGQQQQSPPQPQYYDDEPTLLRAQLRAALLEVGRLRTASTARLTRNSEENEPRIPRPDQNDRAEADTRVHINEDALNARRLQAARYEVIVLRRDLSKCRVAAREAAASFHNRLAHSLAARDAAATEADRMRSAVRTCSSLGDALREALHEGAVVSAAHVQLLTALSSALSKAAALPRDHSPRIAGYSHLHTRHSLTSSLLHAPLQSSASSRERARSVGRYPIYAAAATAPLWGSSTGASLRSDLNAYEPAAATVLSGDAAHPRGHSPSASTLLSATISELTAENSRLQRRIHTREAQLAESQAALLRAQRDTSAFAELQQYVDATAASNAQLRAELARDDEIIAALRMRASVAPHTIQQQQQQHQFHGAPVAAALGKQRRGSSSFTDGADGSRPRATSVSSALFNGRAASPAATHVLPSAQQQTSAATPDDVAATSQHVDGAERRDSRSLQQSSAAAYVDAAAADDDDRRDQDSGGGGGGGDSFAERSFLRSSSSSNIGDSRFSRPAVHVHHPSVDLGRKRGVVTLEESVVLVGDAPLDSLDVSSATPVTAAEQQQQHNHAAPRAVRVAQDSIESRTHEGGINNGSNSFRVHPHPRRVAVGVFGDDDAKSTSRRTGYAHVVSTTAADSGAVTGMRDTAHVRAEAMRDIDAYNERTHGGPHQMSSGTADGEIAALLSLGRGRHRSALQALSETGAALRGAAATGAAAAAASSYANSAEGAGRRPSLPRRRLPLHPNLSLPLHPTATTADDTSSLRVSEGVRNVTDIARATASTTYTAATRPRRRRSGSSARRASASAAFRADPAQSNIDGRYDGGDTDSGNGGDSPSAGGAAANLRRDLNALDVELAEMQQSVETAARLSLVGLQASQLQPSQAAYAPSQAGWASDRPSAPASRAVNLDATAALDEVSFLSDTVAGGRSRGGVERPSPVRSEMAGAPATATNTKFAAGGGGNDGGGPSSVLDASLLRYRGFDVSAVSEASNVIREFMRSVGASPARRSSESEHRSDEFDHNAAAAAAGRPVYSSSTSAREGSSSELQQQQPRLIYQSKVSHSVPLGAPSDSQHPPLQQQDAKQASRPPSVDPFSMPVSASGSPRRDHFEHSARSASDFFDGGLEPNSKEGAAYSTTSTGTSTPLSVLIEQVRKFTEEKAGER